MMFRLSIEMPQLALRSRYTVRWFAATLAGGAEAAVRTDRAYHGLNRINHRMSNSGHIQLDGEIIRYRSSVYGDWDLPVSEVRMIGEAADPNGPVIDDYFFCFATGPEQWVEASFYADGRDEFLRALGAKLGAPLECGLCHSTDYASRVLWPPSLAGEPMFHYEDLPPEGVLGRLLGIPRNRQTYSKRVAEMLAGGA